MRLRLHEATACGRFTTGQGEMRFRAFAHATEPLIIVDMQCEGTESPTISMIPARESSPEIEERLSSWGYAPVERGESKDISYWAQDLPAGGQYAVAWRVTERRSRRHTAWVTVAHDPEGHGAIERAVADLTRLSESMVPELHAEHRAWWSRHYQASLVSVPETRLEGLYWLEVYKLAAGTRPDRPPLALHGPWSQDGRMPPWSGDYHWNINMQMTYWPIYAANRLEFGRAVYDMVDAARPRLAEWCRRFFGCDGEFLFHATDLHCEPVFDWASGQFEANGLAWVCHHYWLHWRYSQDREFLRQRAFPLMKAAVQPLLHLLEPGEDGRLHLPWSFSPEYQGNGRGYWGPDTTCDLALIRFLCGALLESAHVLRIEDAELPRWEDTLEHLAPYPADATGLKVRADLPYESSHRHPSHLMPLHPLHLLTWETDRDLVEQSLRNWILQGHGEWVGFSMAWAASLAAHAGRPNLAANLLRDYCDRFASENTFNLQGPMHGSDMSVHGNYALTLEAGFGAANAVQEMLLQSHAGTVRVFPAVPPSWPDAAFWNLRAEGAFLVSAVRREGHTAFVHVRSEAGGTLRLDTEFVSGPVWVESGGARRPAGGVHGEILVEMAPAQEILLWAGSQRPDCRVIPLPARDHERNFFGVKRVPRW